MARKEDVVIYEDGAIHTWFELSYANYLTLPRAVLQSMPHEWQDKFVYLLNEIEAHLGIDWEPRGGYRVLALNEDGLEIQDEYSNYERGRRRLPVRRQHTEGDCDGLS